MSAKFKPAALCLGQTHPAAGKEGDYARRDPAGLSRRIDREHSTAQKFPGLFLNAPAVIPASSRVSRTTTSTAEGLTSRARAAGSCASGATS